MERDLKRKNKRELFIDVSLCSLSLFLCHPLFLSFHLYFCLRLSLSNCPASLTIAISPSLFRSLSLIIIYSFLICYKTERFDDVMERDEQRKEVNGSWRKSGSRWEKEEKIELERDRDGKSEDGQEKRGRGTQWDRRKVSSLFLALSKSSAFTLHSLFYSPPHFVSPSPLSVLSLSLSLSLSS